MTTFQLINGWTKESMIATVKLRNTGAQCQSPSGGYAYENSQGNHCAVGCFIPPGHDAMKSGAIVPMLVQQYPDLAKNWPLEPQAMGFFQSVHDTADLNANIHQLLEDWINTHTTV